MVIYGNNLHEKLQGLAISRDYLKYNTPFCDLVDAPEWQLDINLALDYNCAINGSADCAFTASVKPKDRIEIDNNANAKNPDGFIFNINRASEYLCFQSN